ncbi:YME1, partial [Symbiodinium microadriaticum]
ARLDVLMGGKAAEELIFGPENVTAGCTSDLRQATGLARRMVMNFGMAGGKEAGLLSLDVDEYAVLSDEAKQIIDHKTQSLLNDAYHRASEYLRTHRDELHHLAKALIEYETLSAEEIQLAIKGQAQDIGGRRKQEAETTKKEMENLTPKATLREGAKVPARPEPKKAPKTFDAQPAEE